MWTTKSFPLQLTDKLVSIEREGVRERKSDIRNIKCFPLTHTHAHQHKHEKNALTHLQNVRFIAPFPTYFYRLHINDTVIRNKKPNKTK